MRFYCDVHRKRDDTGYRVTYTTDGEDFRHVDSPVEIPAGLAAEKHAYIGFGC
ncbi:MAG: hypothetical protein QXE96_03835 [Candidatus Caldarchaeum sp.]